MTTFDEAAFDVRWANWVARGRVHEAPARRHFAIGGAGLMLAVAVAYLIVR